MIRNLFIFIIVVFHLSLALAVDANYIGTEKKYFFTSDTVRNAISDHFSEKYQVAAAREYNGRINSEGKVSVEDLFAVCRTGGLNTYRFDGYDACRKFIITLLGTQNNNGILSGFCPGVVNGKNPNALQTITDKIKIGDVCRSTNIHTGLVVFKPGYNCTCMATACNLGYYIQGGACLSNKVVANTPVCTRQEYTGNGNNNSAEKCFSFCGLQGNKQGCLENTSIWDQKNNKCICNATYDEVDAFHNAKIDALPYRAVCGIDKGKRGGTEYCISDFKGLQVGMRQAAALAAEYATIKNKHKIYCSDKTRPEWNDDYVQCVTEDKKYFYEFQFDDVKESFDSVIDRGVRQAICLIHGRTVADYGCFGGCDDALKKTAQRFSMETSVQSGSNVCMLKGMTIKSDEMDKLATLPGIDNWIFYSEIQLQANQSLTRRLRDYINTLPNYVGKIKKFECNPQPIRLKNGGTDDVLRCYLNEQPIDFIFDDLSEAVSTTSESGEAGMACIISGGAFANKKCHGLDQKQCSDVNAKLKAQNPKTSGTKWQNGQCILLDVQEQNVLETGMQIGASVVAVLDCATVIIGNAQGVMGCALAVVEIGGLVTELTTGQMMQQGADEFIKIAVDCRDRNCALDALKTMAGQAMSVKDALASASTAQQIDIQLARLVGYLEPEDLQGEVSADDWNNIVQQLGGDPNDSAWRALTVANKIGFIAQFASLGASAFRLTGKAIAKIASKSAGKTATGGGKALAVVGTHTDDATNAFAKATEHADETVRMTSNGARTSERVQDIIYDAAYFTNHASGTDDVFKGADDIVQVNRQNVSPKTIKDLMKNAKKYGFECTDCGGDVIKFSKKIDGTSDGVHTTTTAGANTSSRATGNINDINGTERAATRATAKAEISAKTEKIEKARQTNNLGFHGTDADIEMTDMIRPSQNSSGQLGNVGYGIAGDYKSAERYAVKRLVERQNVGRRLTFTLDGETLIIHSDGPLNLSNKTGFVYTTAKDSNIKWDGLVNDYVGPFKAAKMPNAVEILDKTSFDLDDLIRQGKVKIVVP